MDFSKIVNDIEISKPEDIENYIENLKQKLTTKSEMISMLLNKKIENESQLKSYIIDNSENIIEIFTSLQKLKEEFQKSKRGFDSIANQMLILKKKYIEPFEKLKQSSRNKSNIESVIELYDKIKSFKNEVKILKNHYIKNTLTLTTSNFEIFAKIKRYPQAQFIGINFIKDELEWFNHYEKDILNKFEDKFKEAVILKDKKTIFQFFDFYSQINLLVEVIKNFSNKILRELMVEHFFNQSIKEIINKISPLDMFYENVLKIRKEIKDFFINLENYSVVFDNLGTLLKSSYDKGKFVLYENIMEIVRI